MKESLDVIELKAIKKSFGRKTVFENLNLAIPPASITGICGPNGAGKSILLRIICGLVKPTQGEVWVLGKQVGIDCDFPPLTGALIDTPGFLSRYSAKKNLRLLAAISQRADNERIDEVLAIVGLDVNDQRPVRTYSGGMKKRLGIAQAILEDPQLLILDEPTDAIDQAGWKNIYEYLIKLKERGATILLTSNNLDEITILCDQAYMLQAGNLAPILSAME